MGRPSAFWPVCWASSLDSCSAWPELELGMRPRNVEVTSAYRHALPGRRLGWEDSFVEWLGLDWRSHAQDEAVWAALEPSYVWCWLRRAGLYVSPWLKDGAAKTFPKFAEWWTCAAPPSWGSRRLGMRSQLLYRNPRQRSPLERYPELRGRPWTCYTWTPQG